MRRILSPLRRPLRVAGPLTVSVITPFPPSPGSPPDPPSASFLACRPRLRPGCRSAFADVPCSCLPGSDGTAVGRAVRVLFQVPASQRGDFLFEVVQRLETPVHRGKPEVRDLVEVAERPEDRQPYLVGRHFRQA